MPYIEWEDRRDLTPLGVVIAETPGQLNFQITVLILNYLEMNGLSYQTINDIQGAIRNAGVEFDRRVTAPYETKKILQNGDVYSAIEEMLQSDS
jgi:hypothetical protein